MQAHRGADAVQIVIAGCAILGSSSVPARTNMIFGPAPDSVNIGVPHCGQIGDTLYCRYRQCCDIPAIRH